MFLVLSEELHFGRAAARLFVTQPALSRQISALERRLKLSLVHRDSRNVRLTAAGSALLTHAAQVVASVDHLRSTAERSRREANVVTVAMFEASAALASTRAVLGAVRARCPRLVVRIVTADLAGQLAGLANGTFDLVFGYLPVPAGVCAQPVSTTPRLLCVAGRAPVADRPEITLADLAGQVVAGVSDTVPEVWRRFWAADPRPGGSPVHYSGHEVTSVEELLAAVLFDEVIAFVPAEAAELYPRPGIRYLPVRDLPPCTAALAWLKTARHPSIPEFRRAARETYESAGGRPASGAGCPAPLAAGDPDRVIEAFAHLVGGQHLVDGARG
ncbi:LysR family transcriptional regulator [Amycolatopsis sp. NPDC059021]|uniref:LysR family transcriptional regulator n=1 Tax=Amycolatopsis sp. NPDC059021 TaxID=3346704 RepID=UPI003672417F